MFRTNLDFESRLPNLFGRPPGVQHWSAFEIVFHNIWFIVEFLIEAEDGEGEFWKMLCFDRRIDVINLVNADFVKEHRVNIVVPANRTEMRQMMMKPLVEIIDADEDGQRSMTIYVTSDGTRILDTALGFTEEQAENKTIVYMKKDIDVMKEQPDAFDL